jgi:alkyl hydroperoxide reductase subunit AhpC
VIAVSVDSHFSHLAWKNTPREKGGLGQINIPLLADITKEISRNYGVLVEDPLDGLNGATLRGLFVIDGKGKIRSITINDEQVGRNVDETIRIIQAFQHADKHGVVCPAGWKPGSKTIIPDQNKSKDYFKSQEL